MNTSAILHLLEKNARMSVQDLADVFNTDEASVQASLQDLQKQKIICGYHTVINWDKTNTDYVHAMIEVNATPQRDTGYDKIAALISKYPEVSSVYLMSGRAEFLVVIEGKTMQEIANFVGQKLAPIEGVRGTTTLFVMKRYKVDGVILEEEEKTQERMLML